jgi:two-component system, chemotaxis family, chemotaxis protein CheY
MLFRTADFRKNTMNILIIDSNHEHRKILVRLLANYGICDVADNSIDAVKAFMRAFDDHNPYQMLMIDAQLPRIDAAALLATMRFIERQYNGTRSKVMIALPPDSPRLTVLRDDDRWDALFLKPYTDMDIVKALMEFSVTPAPVPMPAVHNV